MNLKEVIAQLNNEHALTTTESDADNKLLFKANDISYFYRESTKEFTAIDANENQLGFLEVRDATGDFWLDQIEVNKDSRRQGIGTNLIKAAVQVFGGGFKVPYRVNAGASEFTYYFADSLGIWLAEGCINKAILKPENYNFYPPICGYEDQYSPREWREQDESEESREPSWESHYQSYDSAEEAYYDEKDTLQNKDDSDEGTADPEVAKEEQTLEEYLIYGCRL